MKRRTILQGLAAAGPLAGASSGWSNRFAQQLRDDFLSHWRSTREYTMEVLEAMPAEHLDFRPVPEQRTFAEQLAHLARANAGYFSRFEKDAGRPRPEQPQTLSRESVRTYLRDTFDYVEAVLEALNEEDFQRRDLMLRSRHTAQDVFLRAYMHTAHHRGQIITYLRVKGITPPRWRFPANGEE